MDRELEYPEEDRKSFGKWAGDCNIQGKLGNQLESGRGTGISRGSSEINWKIAGHLNIQGKLGNQLESG